MVFVQILHILDTAVWQRQFFFVFFWQILDSSEAVKQLTSYFMLIILLGPLQRGGGFTQ